MVLAVCLSIPFITYRCVLLAKPVFCSLFDSRSRSLTNMSALFVCLEPSCSKISEQAGEIPTANNNMCLSASRQEAGSIALLASFLETTFVKPHLVEQSRQSLSAVRLQTLTGKLVEVSLGQVWLLGSPPAGVMTTRLPFLTSEKTEHMSIIFLSAIYHFKSLSIRYPQEEHN